MYDSYKEFNHDDTKDIDNAAVAHRLADGVRTGNDLQS